MDRKAIAKELREKLFDFIESERREALQDDAIDKLFEGVLAKHAAPQSSEPQSVGALVCDVHGKRLWP